MGIGLLGFPYAMRVSGFIPGLIISTMCASITNYTAKVYLKENYIIIIIVIIIIVLHYTLI